MQRHEQVREVVDGQFGIAEDRRQQARAEDLAGMYRHGSCVTVGMFQDYMASASSLDSETNLLKSAHDILPCRARQAGHTEIC